MGVAGFGVCDTEPFEEVRRHLDERLRDGTSAGLGFTYTDPAVSTDPRATHPWAHRLVVLAWAYMPEAGSPGPGQPGTGRIARFATADHYQGLRRALEALTELLRGDGYRAQWLADDDRLVDRAVAVRAGVGWWGKSTMVLAPGHGPWMLLGSVATDAELPTTAPMVRDCGTCDACIPACPTGAITAPGVLDASRCLARWAQAPGAIPVAFRGAMGDRVYGCDECLAACPPGRRPLAAGPDGGGRVDLVALLAAPDAELLATYGHFYLPGRSPATLRRNALVAMGNAPGPGAVEVLAGYLGHPHPMLRRHAAWALGAAGTSACAEVLRAALATETDPEVLAEIRAALGEGSPVAPPTLAG